MICSQPIVWTVRKIESNQQKYIEKESVIELHDDVVITPTERFDLHEVHDASYRSLTGSFGFFYLHTIRGVFSYRVKVSPSQWISEFKKVQIK
ncbi:hypothetical protein [Halobacillus sp. Marseille-Q1614]|uniref:hypothetical protein n=1 Tax=Halobacillus sp. Marseille-Q1614 TaxID=2709134 RepID=UPI00156E2AE3|nr:hypothetical protein [Halobacillus sp. Marseille-Q1614]